MASPLTLAQDPRTPPATLTQLALTGTDEVLRAVACNPNAPLEALALAAGTFPEEVLQNPALDLLLLEDSDLWTRWAPDALGRIAASPRCPASLGAWALRQRWLDESFRDALVENPALPLADRQRLCVQGERVPERLFLVRLREAGFPPEALDVFFRLGLRRSEVEDDEVVRRGPLGEDELTWLFELGGPCPLLVLRARECPPSLLQRALLLDATELQGAALRHPCLDAATCARVIAAGAPAQVRTLAWSEALQPEHLLALAGSADPQVLVAVSQHPAAPDAALIALTEADELMAQVNLLARPTLSASVQHALATRGLLAARARLASSHHATPDILALLASQGDPGVEDAVAGNPCCPPALLQRITERRRASTESEGNP
jgi:hypothetical protein